MDWKIVLKKAAEGAVLAAAPVAGVTQPTNPAEAVPAILSALVGALLKAGWNWYKHRKD